MTEQLVLPADYPVEILRLRAIESLSEELDKAILARTGLPIRAAGLQIGLLLVIGYLDTVGGGFLSGAPRDLLTFVQLALMAGIVGFLGYAIITGRRLQQAHEAKVAGIRSGQLSALKVLNAVMRDVQVDSEPAIEPRAIMAEGLASSQRSLRAAKNLQGELDQVTAKAVQAPALADTVDTPQNEPRRIGLGPTESV